MKLTRYKRESSYSYTLGATLTYELLKTHPELIQRVFLRPNIKHGNDLEQIIAALKQRHIEIIESTKAFNILNAKSNCLLIAEFQKPATQLDYSANNPHIVLVNPSDAGNLGTIMRSAIKTWQLFSLAWIHTTQKLFAPPWVQFFTSIFKPSRVFKHTKIHSRPAPITPLCSTLPQSASRTLIQFPKTIV